MILICSALIKLFVFRLFILMPSVGFLFTLLLVCAFLYVMVLLLLSWFVLGGPFILSM